MGVFDPEIARPRVKSAAMISRSGCSGHQPLRITRTCRLTALVT